MSLIGNAIKSNFTLKSIKPIHGVSLFLREPPKRFSTESEQPPPPPPPPQNSSVDSFLQTPNTGLVYGRLTGTTRNTLKSDIINLLDGCPLTLDDVKVNYNRTYVPVGMMVQFPSHHAFSDAIRAINKKGRLYKLEKSDRNQWDLLTPYNGKTVLLQGLPRPALSEDIERFLSGCDYGSINTFTRPAFPDPIRMALVQFPSQTQAMNAFIKKNNGFCLNSQILVRVLH